MDKIEKLKQILQVANQDTVSYKQLSELLKVLAKTITDAKNENKAISDEMKDLFSKSVAYLEDEHKKLVARIESNNDKRIERVEQEGKKVLEKALTALNEIKSIVVVDGIDGKDGVDGKDGKDGSPDTREQIVDKINSGKDKDKKIDAKQITGLPEFTKEVVREISVGHPETPIKGGTGITVTRDASGANVITATGGTTDEKVKLDASDPTAGYLDAKLQEGVQQVAFDLTPSTTVGTGKMQWNAVDGTVDIGMLNGSTLQVGQELYFYGKASGNIANGEVCEFAGVQGDHILMKKAVPAEIIANPHYLIGVATQNITNGEFGYVTWFGKVNGVYTKTPANNDDANWVEGDILYFDNTTGQLTKNAPSAPEREIIIAAVIKLQTGASENGIIVVRPTFGKKLSDLEDVDGTAPSVTGQLLSWNQTAGVWERASYNITEYSKTDEKVKFNDGDPTAGYLSDKTLAGTGISLAEGTGANENKLVISNTAPFVDAPSDGNSYGRKNGAWSSIVAGLGDMVLDAIQSVTGLKTFDKDKFAMKGTSTGKTVLSTANTSATDYTATLPAKDGTIAMTTDIVDEKVKYDAGDSTAGYVADKFVAGTGITIAEGTGADENKLKITNSAPATIDGSGTTNEITYWVDSNTVGALAVATYPSLTELSYVKGVTSAIQTQFTGKLSTQYPIDRETYGFLNRTETTISFDGTKTFTLAKVGASWSYYRTGVKYTITASKSVDLVPSGDPVDGTLYYIYLDSTDGTLTCDTGGWTLADTKVPVATVKWNNTLTPKYIMADERHSCGINRAWHREHHFVEGTKASSYGTISGLTAGSDTPANKTFGISGITIFDEDIKITPSDLADPDGATAVYNILYRTSATSYSWVLSDMPFKYTTSAGPAYGFIEYDLNGTSTPSQAQKFVNTYLYVSNAVANTEADPEISTVSQRYFIMQGRNEYSSAALAQAEKFIVSAGMPVAEGTALYQFTWSTTNRPNSVKGRCQYVSTQQINANNITTSVVAATSHNGLSGLDGGTAGEYYHLTSAQHTVATAEASTSAIGLAPQATAPAAGLYNYLGITNGETAYTNKALFDATVPSTQAFGDAAAAGSAAVAARRDHKHAMPANPVSGTINEIAYFDSTSTVKSLAVATYPSLTELSYVKGVTSAIQTQIGNLVAKATYDAHTILYATTDNTPVALTVSEQTVVGRATGGNISAIAIDSDLSSVSANDDTIPSAKATKAALDLKAPLASPTFTGTVTLADNARINLTLPTTTEYCTGPVTASFNAGYSSAIGDLVFFGSGGKWLEVDSDAVATCQGLMGIALEAKTDGQAMKVALPNSMVRWDTWNWTVGATLYAGETLGALQETIPTGADAIIKVVGFALNADTIYFNPSPDQQSTIA